MFPPPVAAELARLPEAGGAARVGTDVGLGTGVGDQVLAEVLDQNEALRAHGADVLALRLVRQTVPAQGEDALVLLRAVGVLAFVQLAGSH